LGKGVDLLAEIGVVRRYRQIRVVRCLLLFGDAWFLRRGRRRRGFFMFSRRGGRRRPF
jgi:hypothetical protein